MKESMNKMLKSMGMSDSTSELPEKLCDICKEPVPTMQHMHPFKKTLHWVYCACPCKIKAMEEFKLQQEREERRRRINKFLKLSSSLDEIKNMTFENYQIREGTENMVKEVTEALDKFDELGKTGIFIFGETGNGKSHLTAAAGNVLIDRGYSVIFITEKDLLRRFSETRNFNNHESFHEIMDACLKADLLIWDDFLSSQKLSLEEKDWIFQVVNGRERGNRPIWATSNLTPEEFEDDRTAYRLDDKGRTWWRLMGNMTCIYNRASNYRKVKALSRAMGITEKEFEEKGLPKYK